MTSREERILLSNLAELMSSDLSAASTEDLLAGVRDAEATADRAIDWSGQLLAQLKERMSWTDLVKATGMPQTTMHQRVNPRPTKRKATE